jgi:hypothetical protein
LERGEVTRLRWQWRAAICVPAYEKQQLLVAAALPQSLARGVVCFSRRSKPENILISSYSRCEVKVRGHAGLVKARVD